MYSTILVYLYLDWGKKRLWHRVAHGRCVGDLESTLEWTSGEVIVNSGMHSVPYTIFFFGFGLRRVLKNLDGGVGGRGVSRLYCR
jgi:hypothetical protein